MRLFPALALSLSLLMCGCGDPEPPKTVDAVKELRPLIGDIYAAWGALDVDKASKFYTKDPGAAFYDISPLKYTGWAEYSTGIRKTFAGWKSMKIEIGPDFQAHSNGTVAWVTFTAYFTIEPKTGEKMTGQGRFTEVLHKEKTGWIVVHEHASVVAPDTPPPVPVKKKAERTTKKRARRR